MEFDLPFLELTLGFVWFVFVIETYLDYRQYRKLCEKNAPKELDGLITQEKFDAAQAYGRDRSRFGFVRDIYSQLETTVFLLLQLMPMFWQAAGDVLVWCGMQEPGEILQSLVFVAIVGVLSTVTSLPFDLYSTFVIEERHGFNKQTLGLFFTDLLKSLAIAAVIGAPLISALILVIQWGGEYFYLWVCLFLLVVTVIMTALYPNIIEPLFNKVEPLPEGPLREEINAVAARVRFPLANLFVIDGSKRSAKSNAYMYGFLKKRVVLYDTLINQCRQDEVVGTLAHELGHWSHSHTYKLLFISLLSTLVQFFLFGQVMHNPFMYSAFGFSSHPTIIGLLLFSVLYAPVEHVLGLAVNALSRRFEYQADAYAKQLGYGESLCRALKVLQEKNLGTMNPDWLYSLYHNSHPTFVERLNALSKPKAA